MTRDDLVDRLDAFFADDPDALVVYLFGSRAREDHRAPSDVDVAVLFSEPSSGFDGLELDVEARLEEALDLAVQLVVLNHAPPDLVHRILRDGILVLDRDSSTRIRFEVRARNEYFDLEPVRRRYRKLSVVGSRNARHR